METEKYDYEKHTGFSRPAWQKSQFQQYEAPSDEGDGRYAEQLVQRTPTFPTEKQRQAVIKRVGRIIEKEKLQKLKAPTRLQSGIQKLRSYEKAKKQPKFSKALLGLTQAFLPEGAEGFEGSQSEMIAGRPRKQFGRGRPKGSYKARFIQGVGVVRVPTHEYNRMVRKMKRDRRLAAAQRAAKQMEESEAIAISQDPRFQHVGDDEAFLNDDQPHAVDIDRFRSRQIAQQQVEPQRRGMLSRLDPIWNILNVSKFAAAQDGRQPRRPLTREEIMQLRRQFQVVRTTQQTSPRISLMGSEERSKNARRATRLQFTGQRLQPNILRRNEGARVVLNEKGQGRDFKVKLF